MNLQGDPRNDSALLNIGAVSRMTGIPEATLRVWERRYGFPQAERSAGGHRLYSHADVAKLEWVKARLSEGMQVNRAIRALRKEVEDGTFSPNIWPAALEGGSVAVDALHRTLQQRLMHALLQHDVEAANHVIGDAHGYCTMEEIILDILLPTFNAIGEGWERGEIDVATEHLATNHLRHHLLLCIRLGPPPFNVRPVVLACAPGELHEGSLLMIGALLRRLRWPILYLGQTLPLADLPALLNDLRPSAVVFVAMTEPAAWALSDLASVVANQKEENSSTRIVFGGRAFVQNPALIKRVPGIYLGDTIDEGIRELDSIMHQLHPRLQ